MNAQLNDGYKNFKFVSSASRIRRTTGVILRLMTTAIAVEGHNSSRTGNGSGLEVLRHFPITKWHSEKIMVTVWWFSVSLINHSSLNSDETYVGKKCCQQIHEMHQILKHLRSTLINRKNQILLQDNVRSHVVRRTLEELYQLCYETLLCPSNLPDISPTDYNCHFFKHLDNFLE